jgi:hypothetical protein
MKLRKLHLVILVLVMVVSAFVFLCIRYPPRNMFGRDEGYAEDVGALRKVLRKQICDALPSGATHISYIYLRRHGIGKFQFTVTEQEFLSWAERQGWNVQRVISPESKTVWNPSLGTPRRVTIKDGYYFTRQSTEWTRNFLSLSYNNDTNTVFLEIEPPYKGDMFKK